MNETASAAFPQTEKLKRLFETDWKATLQEYPVSATFAGEKGFDHLWTDQSFEAIEERAARRRRVLVEIESIDPQAVEPACRLDHELFLRRCREIARLDAFPEELLVMDQMKGPQQGIPRVLSQMRLHDAGDYENALERLRRAARLIDQERALLERGLRSRVVPPAIALRGVPDQLQALISCDLDRHPLLAAFRKFPEAVAPRDRPGLVAAAEAAVRDSVKPAYQRLSDFLRSEYLPQCRQSVAWKDLPGGAEWYAAKVSVSTSEQETAEGLHQLGLDEMRRIRAEMDEVIASSGFVGGFEAFVTYLKTDDRFFHGSAEGLLAGYRDIAKRIDGELPRLFGKLPRLPYGVQPIPEHAAPSRPTAFYLRGSQKGGRSGTFFANTYDLRARPKWEMEPLTLHEAVPGHHLQISLAQELDGLPEFRKHAHHLAYTEGWGLYAESLGSELGLYADPYARFGQLVFEMWRAVRLVVDTGLHSFGWDRDRAIRFMLESTGKIEHDVVVEIDRYLVMPAQALAYKVGELAIRELRRRASEELGAAFELRAFHDVVLEQGALPLDVLRRRIGEWIATCQEPAPAA
ncbi:MAG: DUF885 domain-containing protein [Candidatus Wallbacteria bacterium]|nr:DUF885 domain-containing protein [Candidatus Wallbacteria bacterium]